MIIDLPRFLEGGRPFWRELEGLLDRLESERRGALALVELRRLHYLYERTASDLARLTTFVGEPETRRYLEFLVARAYAEIHSAGRQRVRLAFGRWFIVTFPVTFRRRLGAFRLALATTLAGCLFGALAILLDPEAKAAVMPFPGLLESPVERVAREESGEPKAIEGFKGTFSAQLMTHNTRVAILTLALGMTCGVGTLVLLFYHGVVLGAVCTDYVTAGQSTFLAGWLLPHGSIEIPAILVAGQAGLVLAGALIGQARRQRLRVRLREAMPDIATLVGGAAVLLVWAGLVESFFSQAHEPELPYALKILLGLVELGMLTAFLGWSGRGHSARADGAEARVSAKAGAGSS